MASCNGEMTSCVGQKRIKKSGKEHIPLDKVHDVGNGSADDSCLMTNTSLESDTVRDPPINNGIQSDVIQILCNMESICSQSNEKKRKKYKKKKKNKEKAAENHNIQIDVEGDTSSIKDDSVGTNLCPDSAVGTDEKVDLKMTKSKRKRMRKKLKLNNASVVDTDEKEDMKIAPSSEFTKNIAPSSELTANNASVVDTDGKADMKTTPFSELTKSQRKKMRKKLKLNNASVVDTDEKEDMKIVPASELTKNNASVADTDEKEDMKIAPSSEFTKNISSLADTDEKEDMKIAPSSELTKNNASVVDTDGKADMKTTPFSELTKSQRKKMRKKLKLNNASVVDTDGKAVIKIAPLSELTVVDTDEKAVLKIAPLSELTKSQRKKRKKKLKLNNASVVDDEAPVPLAELSLIKVDGNSLISERRSNSVGSPSASLLKKHESNGEGGLLLGEKDNVQTYQIKEKLRIYRKRRRLNSSDSEENVEPITVARQASSDSNKVHSFEKSENEVERTQPGECAPSVKVVENVLTENISSSCLTGEIACMESNKILEMKEVELDVHTRDSIPQMSQSSVAGLRVGRADKKLLILDVNGLLADILPYGEISYKADIVIARKSVFKRPFCDDFLRFCFEKFNVGVWSSRKKKNVDMVLNFLMGDSIHKLLFCWHQSHCTDTGFTTVDNNSKPLVLKELRKIWDKVDPRLPWNRGEYDESNTVLLDDSPYKAMSNPPHTAIFPHTYSYKNAGDSSLGPGGDLLVYLEQLAEAPNVQDFVAQNPFGQRAITESNPSWGFYQKCLRVASRQSRDVVSRSGNRQ